MIPQAAITHWRNTAPWPQDAQVEQDLILARALVMIFQDESLSKALALRGGTALHKVYLHPARRYSEDIDLVQTKPEPIGVVLDALRGLFDSWLGEPRRENGPGNVTLRYRMSSEIPPVIPMRLKVEINTREHFTVSGFVEHPFQVASPWFTGKAKVKTYALEELLATKLRALYQRSKGRDLFDLWEGLREPGVDPVKIAVAFKKYMDAEGSKITRKLMEKNLVAKLKTKRFTDDLRPLLVSAGEYDAEAAFELVQKELFSRIA